MTMLQRFLRAVDTLSNVELEGKDRGGMLGEDLAADIIEDGQTGCFIRNPILPHPRKPGFYLETDFLVYTHGVLYCVEIKNFRGKVYYPAQYRMATVQKGWFIFKWKVQRQVFDHYDYSKMVQEKAGVRGEGSTRRDFPNPFLKTQQYIEDLKRYLNHLDARFAQIPIYPVVGFSQKTDISAIYNPKQGILHIDELPAFFEQHGARGPNKPPAPWIVQGLAKLPTWDKVQTTNNEWINGTLLDPALTFQDTRGKRHTIPYAQIRCIELDRAASFSDYDKMKITFTNGKQELFQSRGGEVRLNRFQGELQIHKLRNINTLLVGIANRPR